MDWPGIETGHSRLEASDKDMNNGTAVMASQGRRSIAGFFYKTEYFISHE